MINSVGMNRTTASINQSITNSCSYDHQDSIHADKNDGKASQSGSNKENHEGGVKPQILGPFSNQTTLV
jgi:hypothetical protein